MATPPLYNHARSLYAAFVSMSQPALPEEAESFGVTEGDLLFVGHWSTTFRGMEGLPGESTQQKAYAWLQDVGCIEVLRQGGRDVHGVILLKGEPTQDDLENLRADSRYKHSGRLGAVEVSTTALVNRVSALEKDLNALNQRYDVLVRDTELRLSQLNARVSA